MNVTTNKSLLVVFGLILANSISAQAAFQDNILWSDAKGLIRADKCQNVRLTQNPFAIAEGVEADRASISKLILKNAQTARIVPARTLVEVTGASTSNSDKYVRVVNATTLGNPKFYVSRNDEGSISAGQVQPINDYVVKIGNTSETKKISSALLTMPGTIWQVAMEDDKYLGQICNDSSHKVTYTLFNVFTKESAHAIAQVGVTAGETNLFKNVQVLTSDEIEMSVTENDDETVDATPAAPTKVITPSASPSTKTTNKGAAPATNTAPQRLVDPTTATKDTTSNPAPTTKPAPSTAPQKDYSKSDSATSDAEKLAESALDSKDSSGTVADYLVCTQDSGLSIREQDGDLMFMADQFETVQIVQSWDGNKDTTRFQVKFPGRGGKTGYASADFIKPKSSCPAFQAQEADEKTDHETSKTLSSGGNLTSDECCVFPTQNRPNSSYKDGMRRFRAVRGKGKRLHAACDLYQKNGAPAVAVTDGSLVRGMYFFYQGTYAVEAVHSGGYVVRYGELKGKRATNVAAGKKLSAGQVVGYIGRVNSNCCSPMLHFELYTGKSRGSLSNFGSRPFQRRSDLINPTEFLSRWEEKQFGASY